MDSPLLSAGELTARCGYGGGAPEPGRSPALLVDLDSGLDDAGAQALRRNITAWPWVLVGIGPSSQHDDRLARVVDVVVDPDGDALDAMLATISDCPVASTTLALLLRATETIDPWDALVAESLAYSTLQAGPEFARWSRGRPTHGADVTTPSTDGEVLRIERSDGETTIVLSRPERHNAIDRRLRLALHDALRVAVLDGRPVTVIGDGPSFSSGGDLVEFGSFDDPASAHLVRMTNHPAAAMLALGRDRLTAQVHGACVGGGAELAAFAGRVVARPDTFFQLPEVGIGLVPGAGGTVSLPRRIGRQRTNLLALSRLRLDAPTALSWGLVDEIS